MSLSTLRENFSRRLAKEEIEKSYIYVTSYAKEIYSQVLQEKLFGALAKGYRVAPRRTHTALVQFVKQNPEFKVLLNSPDFFMDSPKVMEIIV